LLQRLSQYLLLWGLPGLLAISFLDSAAVPIIGGPDAAVLLLAWQRPMQAILIIFAAAIGSTVGSMVLYRVSRAGGELALTRFGADKIARVKQKLDQNAFAAVMAAMAAPPPFPTKLVIVAAGAFRIRLLSFVNGVLVGRLVRYSVLAYLGARFGDHAADVIRDHYPLLAFLLLASLILFILLRRLRQQEKAPDSSK
jgi:membrane protein YqaA with SNARE-associated domain